MKQTMVILALAGLTSGIACADEASMSVTLNTEQAQARQLGIFFGGTASQYELCVKKGFLTRGSQSAEEIAASPQRADEDAELTYHRQFLTALEKIVATRGFTTPEAMQARKLAWQVV